MVVARRAQRNGLPIMLSCPGMLPIIDRIAERHPELRLVIDHLALARTKDAAAYLDMPNLLALAKRPNVAAKASALPCYSSDSYPYRNLSSVHAPGIRRVRPATHLLGHRSDASALQLSPGHQLFQRGLPFLSETDKEWVMGRAICAWLGWP